MNESILVEFERGGELAPVTSVRTTRSEPHETGIILSGETSASPRGFALSLRPRDEVTRLAIERVQRRLSWLHPRHFEVDATRQGERLRLEGVDAGALPPGSYELRFRVGGMQLQPLSRTIRIRKNKATVVLFREKATARTLRLNRSVEEFDEVSQSILKHPESILDGLSAAEWLTRKKHQDRRKAVLLNILAKLAALPSVKEPLNRMVQHVFFAELDRVYCAVSEEFHELVRRSFLHDAAVHPTHQRLLSRIPGGNAEHYTLHSYREKASSSLQVVVAVPKEGMKDRTHYSDMDIDKGNPGWDLKSFLIHVGELLDPRKTNHLTLHKKLATGKPSDSLYYDVVQLKPHAR